MRSISAAAMTGMYGDYGGQFVSEILVRPLEEFEEAFEAPKHDRLRR